MEDNQYFFSNEEGSNDSNVNMIGGMNVAPTGGMPPEGPTKTKAKDSNCKEELSEINKQNSEITKIKKEKNRKEKEQKSRSSKE